MKIFDPMELIEVYAKTNKKFCLYISFDNNIPWEETIRAAPYLTEEQAICNGVYILSFDTEKEMYKYFDMTVGDDGPTKSNDYKGLARVYALTFNDKGEIETENT
jgi:hypothetical protein